jgi:hypothetical protein
MEFISNALSDQMLTGTTEPTVTAANTGLERSETPAEGDLMMST